jgi:hypothetical protein
MPASAAALTIALEGSEEVTAPEDPAVVTAEALAVATAQEDIAAATRESKA